MSEIQTEIVAPVVAASPVRWYVVHAYSGMEKAVERNVLERINRAGMQAIFGRFLVPTEEVVEVPVSARAKAAEQCAAAAAQFAAAPSHSSGPPGCMAPCRSHSSPCAHV